MTDISVIMPAYDAQAYVEQAIESVLAQTHSGFELIIVNDGSRDKTKEIIEHCALRDKRIILIDSEKNRGVAASLNAGIRVARGKYIARMDADDMILPGRFAVQYRFLEAREEIDVCGTAMRIILPDGRTIESFYPEHDAEIKAGVLFKWPFSKTFAHATIFFRRALFQQFGYDERKRYSEDAHLYLQMAMKGGVGFANLPMPLYRCRRHGASVCARWTREQAEEHIAFLVRTLKDARVLTSEELMLYRKMMAVERISYNRENQEKVAAIFARIEKFCCRHLAPGADDLVKRQIQKIHGNFWSHTEATVIAKG
uniref:Glycosyltransferase involved in cell wall bisynthesis n=1 Tax=Candidatus Kentrum sp. FM TaxID=2126340 RepID=A0A450TJT8_9GAMM|nr:MAG: Glycosyltransferase involved in cell wall bisynthesis [Candidatus Kentron sp. FM]VFJ67736.1 MAG: Glycosyltransferase involved in cell wall bisynthesis [Candidatus Kentron sp. FM]VFK17109.1 MAG: Glycosyltransferase involved in cell wall bisynthesis [Candidatus Kentron sp. FM]